MPLSKYFKGSGEKVMSSMKKEYGEEKGKQVFYATANKHKKDSEKGESKKHEKKESKKKEKLETGPSETFKKKFGLMK